MISTDEIVVANETTGLSTTTLLFPNKTSPVFHWSRSANSILRKEATVQDNKLLNKSAVSNNNNDDSSSSSSHNVIHSHSNSTRLRSNVSQTLPRPRNRSTFHSQKDPSSVCSSSVSSSSTQLSRASSSLSNNDSPIKSTTSQRQRQRAGGRTTTTTTTSTNPSVLERTIVRSQRVCDDNRSCATSLTSRSLVSKLSTSSSNLLMLSKSSSNLSKLFDDNNNNNNNGSPTVRSGRRNSAAPTSGVRHHQVRTIPHRASVHTGEATFQWTRASTNGPTEHTARGHEKITKTTVVPGGRGAARKRSSPSNKNRTKSSSASSCTPSTLPLANDHVNKTCASSVGARKKEKLKSITKTVGNGRGSKSSKRVSGAASEVKSVGSKSSKSGSRMSMAPAYSPPLSDAHSKRNFTKLLPLSPPQRALSDSTDKPLSSSLAATKNNATRPTNKFPSVPSKNEMVHMLLQASQDWSSPLSSPRRKRLSRSNSLVFSPEQVNPRRWAAPTPLRVVRRGQSLPRLGANALVLLTAPSSPPDSTTLPVNYTITKEEEEHGESFSAPTALSLVKIDVNYNPYEDDPFQSSASNLSVTNHSDVSTFPSNNNNKNSNRTASKNCVDEAFKRWDIVRSAVRHKSIQESSSDTNVVVSSSSLLEQEADTSATNDTEKSTTPNGPLCSQPFVSPIQIVSPQKTMNMECKTPDWKNMNTEQSLEVPPRMNSSSTSNDTMVSEVEGVPVTMNNGDQKNEVADNLKRKDYVTSALRNNKPSCSPRRSRCPRSRSFNNSITFDGRWGAASQQSSLLCSDGSTKLFEDRHKVTRRASSSCIGDKRTMDDNFNPVTITQRQQRDSVEKKATNDASVLCLKSPNNSTNCYAKNNETTLDEVIKSCKDQQKDETNSNLVTPQPEDSNQNDACILYNSQEAQDTEQAGGISSATDQSTSSETGAQRQSLYGEEVNERNHESTACLQHGEQRNMQTMQHNSSDGTSQTTRRKATLPRRRPSKEHCQVHEHTMKQQKRSKKTSKISKADCRPQGIRAERQSLKEGSEKITAAKKEKRINGMAIQMSDKSADSCTLKKSQEITRCKKMMVNEERTSNNESTHLDVELPFVPSLSNHHRNEEALQDVLESNNANVSGLKLALKSSLQTTQEESEGQSAKNETTLSRTRSKKESLRRGTCSLSPISVERKSIVPAVSPKNSPRRPRRTIKSSMKQSAEYQPVEWTRTISQHMSPQKNSSDIDTKLHLGEPMVMKKQTAHNAARTTTFTDVLHKEKDLSKMVNIPVNSIVSTESTTEVEEPAKAGEQEMVNDNKFLTLQVHHSQSDTNVLRSTELQPPCEPKRMKSMGQKLSRTLTMIDFNTRKKRQSKARRRDSDDARSIATFVQGTSTLSQFVDKSEQDDKSIATFATSRSRSLNKSITAVKTAATFAKETFLRKSVSLQGHDRKDTRPVIPLIKTNNDMAPSFSAESRTTSRNDGKHETSKNLHTPNEPKSRSVGKRSHSLSSVSRIRPNRRNMVPTTSISSDKVTDQTVRVPKISATKDRLKTDTDQRIRRSSSSVNLVDTVASCAGTMSLDAEKDSTTLAACSSAELEIMLRSYDPKLWKLDSNGHPRGVVPDNSKQQM